MDELQEKVLELWSSGRLNTEEYVSVSFRLSSELVHKLDKAKEFFGVDRTALIRIILDHGIDKVLELQESMHFPEGKEGDNNA